MKSYSNNLFLTKASIKQFYINLSGSPLAKDKDSKNLVWASKIWEPATRLLCRGRDFGEMKIILWYKIDNRNGGVERRSMLGHQTTPFR